MKSICPHGMSVDSLICSGMNARGCADYDSNLQHTHATNLHHARTASVAGSCGMRPGGAGRRRHRVAGGPRYHRGGEPSVIPIGAVLHLFDGDAAGTGRAGTLRLAAMAGRAARLSHSARQPNRLRDGLKSIRNGNTSMSVGTVTLDIWQAHCGTASSTLPGAWHAAAGESAACRADAWAGGGFGRSAARAGASIAGPASPATKLAGPSSPSVPAVWVAGDSSPQLAGARTPVHLAPASFSCLLSFSPPVSISS